MNADVEQLVRRIERERGDSMNRDRHGPIPERTIRHPARIVGKDAPVKVDLSTGGILKGIGVWRRSRLRPGSKPRGPDELTRLPDRAFVDQKIHVMHRAHSTVFVIQHR